MGNGKGVGSYVLVGESYIRYLVDCIFNMVFVYVVDVVYLKLKGVIGLCL